MGLLPALSLSLYDPPDWTKLLCRPLRFSMVLFVVLLIRRDGVCENCICKVLKGFGPVGYCPPEIAQLVERLTVEVTQRSDGPWFESGFPEAFYSDQLC